MQKITPFLWFDDQAEEAVNFYISIFSNLGGDSKIGIISRYDEAGAKATGKPKGSVMIETFELAGQHFTALNGGPFFKFTPAESFFVNCNTEEVINKLFKKLSENGKIRLKLDKYPFSRKYGWVEDKFGLSWQLNLADRGQKITPFLMFCGHEHGKAEEAVKFYTSVFKNSSIERIEHYHDKKENVSHAAFKLNGQDFMAMDSSLDQPLNFNEAVSFLVNCEDQNEIDELWEKLSAVPQAEQCGWLKDKYGVSWQIVPEVLPKLMSNPAKSQNVMKAILRMKKIEIEELENAYNEA